MRIRVFLSFASFFAEHLAPQEPASEYLSFRRWVPFLEIHTWEKGIQLPPQRTFFLLAFSPFSIYLSDILEKLA